MKKIKKIYILYIYIIFFCCSSTLCQVFQFLCIRFYALFSAGYPCICAQVYIFSSIILWCYIMAVADLLP